MAERDFRFDRHYELWKEQNKQISRWAYGTAIFATILLVKVLGPYTNLAGRVATQETELKKVNADLAAIEGERAALEKIGQRLEPVRAIIDREPWTAEKERLKGSLRDLSQAHQTLSAAGPARILDAIRQEGQAAPAPIGQQLAPLPRQPHPLVQAATLFQLDADRIRDAAAAGTFPRLLNEQWDRRVQAEADEKVRRIFQWVDDDFLQPLERLLREDPGAGRVLPALPSSLARTRSDMDDWVRRHLGNRTWYETIQQKDRELSELTAFLRQRQEGLLRLVREQQKVLEPKKQALAERQQLAQAQAAGIRKTLGDLNTQMQKLLPDWLRDLVLPEEMLQLYPLILLGLAGVIAVKAGLVRHHYLVVREGKKLGELTLRDGAVSSLWTLVYRGALGSAATCAMYLGGTALLWWLFERGSSLAAHWLSGQPAAAWAAAGNWLPVVQWFGRALFVGAILGTVGTIVRDRLGLAGVASAGSTSLAPDGKSGGSA